MLQESYEPVASQLRQIFFQYISILRGFSPIELFENSLSRSLSFFSKNSIRNGVGTHSQTFQLVIWHLL